MGSAWPLLGGFQTLDTTPFPPQVSNLKAILQSLVEYSQDVSNCKGT